VHVVTPSDEPLLSGDEFCSTNWRKKSFLLFQLHLLVALTGQVSDFERFHQVLKLQEENEKEGEKKKLVQNRKKAKHSE
jgi:hypothetical protein